MSKRNKNKKQKKTAEIEETEEEFEEVILSTNYLTNKQKSNYSVYITEECMKKLDWITNEYEYEIQVWLGGEVDKDNTLIIDDLLISKHSAGSVSTSVTPKELIAMRKEYGNRCARIIGQFHSHNTMGAFWSLTDTDMQKKFTKNSSKDFCLFIVGSKGDYLSRLVLKKPFYIVLDNIGLEKINEEPEDIEIFKTDILKKVEIQKLPEIKVSNGFRRGWNNRLFGDPLPKNYKTTKKEWWGYDYDDGF